ncbi:phosphosulfolactate synthase [Rhizobium puerariae]|uniref:Phosphosulfolactate synthase n=1 Tax=Rhizobium puerariae TaxID=1585791 RepID=A0ABV6AIT7_9HYPH
MRALHDLIDFPPRSEKPRRRGITMIIDETSFGARNPELMAYADFIDLVKMTIPGVWISDQTFRENLKLYRNAGVDIQLGGVPYELAVAQGKQEQFLDRMLELGANIVEVENHTGAMDMAEMQHEVRRLKDRGFGVVSEVGAKWVQFDDTRKDKNSIDISAVVDKIGQLIEAGSDHIYWEGMVVRALLGNRLENESGQQQLLEVMRQVDAEKVILEVWSARGAPNTPLWAWLVHHLGPEVNLANVPSNQIMFLESIRHGCFYDPGHPYLRWLNGNRPVEKWWQMPLPDYKTDLV